MAASHITATAVSQFMSTAVHRAVPPFLQMWMVVVKHQLSILVIRPLALLIVATWMMASITPAIFAFYGLPPQFLTSMARSPGLHPAGAHIMRAANWTSAGLTDLGLNNAVCKRYISCRAGEFVANEYPTLVSYMKATGLLDRLNYFADRGSDAYVKLAARALTGQNVTCHEEMVPCPLWIVVEDMLDIPRPKPHDLEGQDSMEELVTTENTPSEKLVDDDQPLISSNESQVPTSNETSAISGAVFNAIRGGFFSLLMQ